MMLLTVLVVAGLTQDPAQAAAPPPPLPPRTNAADVLAEFVRHISEVGRYPSETVDFIRKQYDMRKNADDAAALLDEALAVLCPDFKRGLDAASADQTVAAADRFLKLADSDDPYVAANATFFAVQSLVSQEKLRETYDLLQKAFVRVDPLSRYTTHSDHLLFLLAYTQAHMLKYDDARATLQYFLQNCTDAPERFRTTAQQMLTEIERREPGRLGDVFDLMTYAKRELNLGRTDEDVSKRQGEAVSLLDRLIAEAEDEEKKQGQGGGKGGRGRSGRNRSRQQSQSPRQQSELVPSDSADKDLDHTRTAKPGDLWGKMPPKEREQVLQALQKQFPSRYRDLVEQYYRQLSKDAPQP